MNDLVAERLFDGPIAEEYALLKKICPAAADISRRVGEFVGAWQPSPETGTLKALEIGTGTGVTTLHLLHSRPDLHITGIDNGPAMLVQARHHLAFALEQGRLALIENDALTYLRDQPAESFDLVASAYTLHNFLDNYRSRVLEEIQRVLKPGGVFINGDRYALEDADEQLRLTQAEVREYFRIFLAMDRLDLLEQWILHLFSDESPHHVMRLESALEHLRSAGFQSVSLHYREGVNALVSGVKPWP